MKHPAASLSPLQRSILNRLAAQGQACISVKQVRGRQPKRNADSAAFSRSLARLANRGLIVLLNARVAGPGERATHIVLTAPGQEAAANGGPSDAADAVLRDFSNGRVSDPSMPPAPAPRSADSPAAGPARSAQVSGDQPQAGRCCRCAEAERLPCDVLCSGCRQWLRESYPHLAVS